MSPVTPAHRTAATDVVVRYRLAPLFYWAIVLAMLGFVALVTVTFFSPSQGSPGTGWFDWLGMAVLWAMGAFFAHVLARAPMTRLTLGADGSVRLATRTLFAARERRLDPGSVTQVELRRNVFGPILGWQVILHCSDGRSLVLSERADAAAQSALAEELERRLGLRPEA